MQELFNLSGHQWRHFLLQMVVSPGMGERLQQRIVEVVEAVVEDLVVQFL
jgi:hypothetical protein